MADVLERCFEAGLADVVPPLGSPTVSAPPSTTNELTRLIISWLASFTADPAPDGPTTATYSPESTDVSMNQENDNSALS